MNHTQRHVEAVGVAGRSGRRNERIVMSAKRDGKRHGPPMSQAVAARAVGWRSEMSTANRPHGPARLPLFGGSYNAMVIRGAVCLGWILRVSSAHVVSGVRAMNSSLSDSRSASSSAKTSRPIACLAHS